MDFFYLLVCIVGVLGAFYAGILFGIHDCKKRFSIPKGAVGVDEHGYIYS